MMEIKGIAKKKNSKFTVDLSKSIGEASSSSKGPKDSNLGASLNRSFEQEPASIGLNQKNIEIPLL